MIEELKKNIAATKRRQEKSRLLELRYPCYTQEELEESIEQSIKDFDEGRYYSWEEVHSCMEKKYPFLCK